MEERQKNLYDRFKSGINWNGLLFIAHKTSLTLLSFILFSRLNQNDFSTWGSLTSLIFLFLLWLDCGFRKSIPRYAPLFSRSTKTHKTFITSLLALQIIILLIATPFFIFAVPRLGAFFNFSFSPTLIALGAGMFFVEGLLSLMRLVYHAHLWIKTFNRLSLYTLGAEFVSILTLIALVSSSKKLLIGIFSVKIFFGVVLLVLSALKLSRKMDQAIDSEKPAKNLWPAFIRHTAVMGGFTILKSFSERNFMLPFLTTVLGPLQANLFKLANDGALYFYRVILKTVGTTDTAFLAHAQMTREISTKAAFNTLKSLLFKLCLPLLVVVGILLGYNYTAISQSVTWQAFFIMAIGYLLEAAFSPFERLLEVQQKYKIITYTQVPYIIGTLYSLYCLAQGTMGLVAALALIQATRLSSVLLMVAYVKYKEVRSSIRHRLYAAKKVYERTRPRPASLFKEKRKEIKSDFHHPF